MSRLISRSCAKISEAVDDVGAGTAVRGTLPSCSAWREDDLREAGYDFVRWGYGRMFGQTDQTVARILRKLNG